jgi:hypothetical protein
VGLETKSIAKVPARFDCFLQALCINFGVLCVGGLHVHPSPVDIGPWPSNPLVGRMTQGVKRQTIPVIYVTGSEYVLVISDILCQKGIDFACLGRAHYGEIWMIERQGPEGRAIRLDLHLEAAVKQVVNELDYITLA